MRTATKEFKWDMAHRLPTHEGKCFNVHGHTYKALITIEGDGLQIEGPETGMLKDFGNFKPVKDWIDENWDHAYVGKSDDDILSFLTAEGLKVYGLEKNPTAEYMAEYLYNKSKDLLEGIMIKSVTIYETPTSFSTYSE